MFERPKKLFNHYYIVMLLMNVVIPLASYMINPIMSKYTVSKGATIAMAGTIVGAMSIAAMIFRPISNITADRINKKRILMFTSSLLWGVSILYCFVGNTGEMLLLRIVHGCVFSLNSTTFMAYTVQFMPEDKLGEGIGYLSVGQMLASSVGPALGLSLVKNGNFAICFLTAAALYGTAFLMVLVIVPSEHKPQGAASPRRRVSVNDFIALDLLPYVLFISIFSGGNGLATSYLALIGDERNIANVGIFFTVDSVLMLLIRPISGKLTDRKGPLFILIVAYLCGAMAFALIGSAGTLMLILAAAVFKAFSSGSGTPAIQATCLKKAGEERSGVASGTCFIGQDIGQGLAPVLGGLVASIGGGVNYSAMCYAASGAYIFVGFIFCAFYLYEKKKQQPRPCESNP